MIFSDNLLNVLIESKLIVIDFLDVHSKHKKYFLKYRYFSHLKNQAIYIILPHLHLYIHFQCCHQFYNCNT